MSTAEYINTRSETSTAGRQAARKKSERERDIKMKAIELQTNEPKIKELCAALYITTQILSVTIIALKKQERTNNENQNS